MNVLGLSAFGDGSAASLVRDGRVIAAAEEERFTRKLGESALPRRAVRFCLAQGGISPRDVDAWVWSEKPLKRFERVLAGQLAGWPRSSHSFARELFTWLGDRLWIKTHVAAEFGIDPARVAFSARQMALAAAAYFPSPCDEAAVLVVGGASEWATTSLIRARGGTLEVVDELEHPHSLALAARAVAGFMGFPGPNGEALLAALAAHGEPRHVDTLRRMVRVEADGHFALDPHAFASDLGDGLACGAAWRAAFGAPRLPTDPLELSGPHADLAASFQCVLEEALLALARALHARTGARDACIGGAFAHNAAALARLAAEGPFERLFVAPHCGDAGAALGAALHAHALLVPGARPLAFDDARLGEALLLDGVTGKPVGMNGSTESVLDAGARSERMLAVLLAGGTVGWARGRAEFGPHALGQRVLLAAPRAAARAREITRREAFVPFAPALPAERAREYFEIPASAAAPARGRAVLLRATEAAQRAAPQALDARGRANPLFVDARHDPEFHALLARFGTRDGAPLLLVAPLAARGEPPVRSAREAVALFERSALDLLVVEEQLYAR